MSGHLFWNARLLLAVKGAVAAIRYLRHFHQPEPDIARFIAATEAS